MASAFEIEGLQFNFPADTDYERPTVRHVKSKSFHQEYENGGPIDITPELYVITGIKAPNDDLNPIDDLKHLRKKSELDGTPIDNNDVETLELAIKYPYSSYIAWYTRAIPSRIVAFRSSKAVYGVSDFYLFSAMEAGGTQYDFVDTLKFEFTDPALMNLGSRQILLPHDLRNAFVILQRADSPIKDQRFRPSNQSSEFMYSGPYRMLNSTRLKMRVDKPTLGKSEKQWVAYDHFGKERLMDAAEIPRGSPRRVLSIDVDEELFQNAVNSGDLTTVKKLLDKGFNVQYNYNYALRTAAGNGDRKMVELLLENGADVHQDGNAPLNAAVIGGYIDMVKRLLAAKSSVHGREDAFYSAVSNDDNEMLTLLLNNRDSDVPGYKYDGAIAEAVNRNNVEAVRLFSKYNLISNVYGVLDDMLNVAVEKGNVEMIQTLLDAGADIHASNDHALESAAANGNNQVVELLLEAGADIHASGDQPLYEAVYNNHDEVVATLLAHSKTHGRYESAKIEDLINDANDSIKQMLEDYLSE